MWWKPGIVVVRINRQGVEREMRTRVTMATLRERIVETLGTLERLEARALRTWSTELKIIEQNERSGLESVLTTAAYTAPNWAFLVRLSGIERRNDFNKKTVASFF
jgi:hypothetical protein